MIIELSPPNPDFVPQWLRRPVRERLALLAASEPEASLRMDKAYDVLLAATATVRHESRVRAARRVAHAWTCREDDGLLEVGGVTQTCRHYVPTVVLAAEVGGCYGGGYRQPGAATTRLPGFDRLGSGRRQATDGLAWTEAIREAFLAELASIEPGPVRQAIQESGLSRIVDPWSSHPDHVLVRLLDMGVVSLEALASLGDGAILVRLLQTLQFYSFQPAFASELAQRIAIKLSDLR